MSVLLDVNLLLACGWQTHTQHTATQAWLTGLAEFYTCPLAELGFLRVSLSPAFRASFEDAMTALKDLKARRGARELADDLDPRHLPQLNAAGDITDAYLVELARAHRLRLATFDEVLCAKAWAAGIAFHPLAGNANP